MPSLHTFAIVIFASTAMHANSNNAINVAILFMILESLQEFSHILFDTGLDISALSFFELLSYDVLVKFHISVSDSVDNVICHLRNLLALLALETVGHQPLTHEFLRKLLLLPACGKTLRIAFCIEIAR